MPVTVPVFETSDLGVRLELRSVEKIYKEAKLCPVHLLMW